MDYFCVDVESSGPVPGIHNLLSVGLTHVCRREQRYQPFADFYVELRPMFPGFEADAMAVNKLDPERLAAEGVVPQEALTRIVGWVQEQRRANKGRPVFVAHNAPFDWMFFAYYCGHTGVPNPFGYSALDTKALAMGRLGLSWRQTGLKSLASKLDVPPQDPDAKHHAGADARHLATVFCALINRKA